MLINAEKNETGLVGKEIAGVTWRAADGDSVYAIFRLQHLSCGVTIEKGSQTPYLRFTPSVQIPREARRGFERFQFVCDDEEMIDLSFDPKDGEIVLRRDIRDYDPQTIERALMPELAWFDEHFYPLVIDYVANVYSKKED